MSAWHPRHFWLKLRQFEPKLRQLRQILAQFVISDKP
jgi:hypothetical protein